MTEHGTDTPRSKNTEKIPCPSQGYLSNGNQILGVEVRVVYIEIEVTAKYWISNPKQQN